MKRLALKPTIKGDATGTQSICPVGDGGFVNGIRSRDDTGLFDRPAPSRSRLTGYKLTSLFLVVMSFLVHTTADSVLGAHPEPQVDLSGLLLHYSFESDEGATVSDQSGNGNDAVVNNAVWTSDGNTGGGMSFNGVDAFLEFPTTGFPSNSQPRTLVAWVSQNEITNRHYVIGYGGDAGCTLKSEFRMSLNEFEPGQFSLETSFGGWHSTAALSTGTWYHLVITYDGGDEPKFYVNGQEVEVGSTWITPGVDTLLGRGTVGNRPAPSCDPGKFHSGTLDELMIFNRALTPAEVLELFNGGGTTPPGSLEASIHSTVFDDSLGGNGNQFIEEDETITLLIVLEGSLDNTNALTGIKAVLSSTSPGVTVTQAVSTYPDLGPGFLVTNAAPFVFKVESGVPCGSQINFNLTLTSSNTTTKNFPVSIDVGIATNLYANDLEAGLGGITINNSGNGLWHVSGGRGNNAGHTRTNALYYGVNESGAGGGSYDTGTANKGRFTLPPISLLGHTKVLLIFNHILQRENNPPANYDVAKVEVSRDEGATWTTVGGPYASTGTSFQRATINLTPFVNSEVIIRFSFNSVDDRYNAFEGWYVDDILVRSFDCRIVGASPVQIVAQGIQESDGSGVFTVFDGVTGTGLLSQTVLSTTHSFLQSFAVDTTGDGVHRVAVAGRNLSGGVDFEVRDGSDGVLMASGALDISLSTEYTGIAANVDTNSAGQELIFVASPTTPGLPPVIDVRDSSTGASIYSTYVLDSSGYENLKLLAADVNGNGRKDVVVIGQQVGTGSIVLDVRDGQTGTRISFFTPKKTQTGPFIAIASDLRGIGVDNIILLANAGSGSLLLNIVEGVTGKTLSSKRVLKSFGDNPQLVAARTFAGSTKQVVVMGSSPTTGSILGEVWSSAGKRLRAFVLAPSVVAPFVAVAGDVNKDGLDEVVLSATHTGNPLLIGINAASGGPLYAVNQFESFTVSDVRLFVVDVDGDGSADVATHALRDSDGVVVFETRAGVSGALFSSFDPGTDFENPRESFGAHVGD